MDHIYAMYAIYAYNKNYNQILGVEEFVRKYGTDKKKRYLNISQFVDFFVINTLVV